MQLPPDPQPFLPYPAGDFQAAAHTCKEVVIGQVESFHAQVIRSKPEPVQNPGRALKAPCATVVLEVVTVGAPVRAPAGSFQVQRGNVPEFRQIAVHIHQVIGDLRSLLEIQEGPVRVVVHLSVDSPGNPLDPFHAVPVFQRLHNLTKGLLALPSHHDVNARIPERLLRQHGSMQSSPDNRHSRIQILD